MNDRDGELAQLVEADGKDVLLRAVEIAKEALGSNLSAAFALGSLAHGGFAALVSDVDLALVLERADDDAAALIEHIATAVRDQPSPSSELAERLSIFWSDWHGVHAGVGDTGRMPELDRLDLLEFGALLYGEDRRAGAHPPKTEDLVRQAAEFVLARFDAAYRARLAAPDLLVAGGPRVVTKAVLFPVRFRYTLHTGRIGRNEDAARWHSGADHDLVAAAMRWRVDGIDDPDAAVRLLDDGLVGLYRRFAEEYADALRSRRDDELAAALADWAIMLP